MDIPYPLLAFNEFFLETEAVVISSTSRLQTTVI